MTHDPRFDGPQDAGGVREDAETRPVPPERPLFPHPRWVVGIVLIFGVAALIAGLSDPIWWGIGFPCILALFVYLWAGWKTRR